MAETTKIQWAESTWDPWRGCTKVSPGCLNCYAEALAQRNPEVFGGWGKGAVRATSKSWNHPIVWDRKAAQRRQEYDNRHDGTLRAAFKPETLPPPPPRPTVFPSKCDWLDDEVGPPRRAQFLSLMASTPNLVWLLLTKRPENFERLLRECIPYSALDATSNAGLAHWIEEWIGGKPPENVVIGTSVEDQTRMDERGPLLVKIPARLRFLSVEPLLGPVEIPQRLMCDECDGCGRPMPRHVNGCFDPWTGDDNCDGDRRVMPKIDWVIVGGESGPNARKCKLEWIGQVVSDCKIVKVPVFVKQMGSYCVSRNDVGFEGDTPAAWPMDTHHSDNEEPGEYQGKPIRILLRDRKGGDPTEWPAWYRVRETPPDLV